MRTRIKSRDYATMHTILAAGFLAALGVIAIWSSYTSTF